MWLGFFKECMVSLIFLGTNLLSLSITFFWSKLKLWSASQQCLAISFLSQSQFLTDILCSFDPDRSSQIFCVHFIVSVQVRIFPLNMRDIIIYVAQWWEKYLSKRSLIKHTCSWRDKVIVLWTLNRWAKIFLCMLFQFLKNLWVFIWFRKTKVCRKIQIMLYGYRQFYSLHKNVVYIKMLFIKTLQNKWKEDLILQTMN